MLGDERNWLIGLTRLGSPVFQISGGAPEDEGADDDADVDDVEDDGGEDAEDDYKPPTKDEFARMQAALKKANGEAANRRHMLDQHGIDPRTGKRYDEEDDETEEDDQPVKPKRKSADDVDDQPKVDTAAINRLQKQNRIEQKRAAQREARLTAALQKSAASAALTEAGWNGQGGPLIERMIDLGEIEIDDQGDVIGLQEQIAEIKSSMPGWFKETRTTRRRVKAANGAADVDGSDKTTAPPVTEPIGWLQKLENQFQGIDE